MHVVVTTMAAVSEGTAVSLGPRIADLTSTLVVDEAHHIAARRWSSFRDYFSTRHVLQFTATPFRHDGKLIDGNVIFSYPLHRPQEDEYFKSIKFDPVCEIDEKEADRAIAIKASTKLTEDFNSRLDHILMVRCKSIERAELCPSYRPILVHSSNPASAQHVQALFSRASRIVVCVEMLGEGFDLPQIKIAAVHDTHKSLAVLLQFIGRFTRTAGGNIGGLQLLQILPIKRCVEVLNGFMAKTLTGIICSRNSARMQSKSTKR